ncbi:MAG: CHAP domain-containing protein [Eubacteriaceae bacterium]|nr:CHAP domain-containing protein [Eubacteriaceae bacterium]
MKPFKKLNIEWRRIICFALIAALVLGSSGITAFGADGASGTDTSGGAVLTDAEGMFTYEVSASPFIGQNGTVTVKKAAETRQPDDPAYGYFVIPEKVAVDAGTFDVTAIDAEAFGDVTEIKGVVIPDSVTEIAETAFALKSAGEQKASPEGQALLSSEEKAAASAENTASAGEASADGQSAPDAKVAGEPAAMNRQIPIYCNEGSAAKAFAEAQGCEVKTDAPKIVTAADTFKVGEMMAADLDKPSFIGADAEVTWSVSDEAIATIDESGNITGAAPGEVTVTAEMNGLTASKTVTIEAADAAETGNPAAKDAQTIPDSEVVLQGQIQAGPAITYQTHVENVGWTDRVTNGVVSGQPGSGLRVEALRIGVDNAADLGVTYQTHVQNIGWQDWVNTGEQAGTTGQALRVEAFRMKLTGGSADKYSVCYRVYVHNYGWLNWVKDGETTGSTGISHQIEGIQIVLRDKNAAALTADKLSFLDAETVRASTELTYRSHVSDIGWQDYVSEGQMTGTTGQSKRIEAFDANLSGLLVTDQIQYKSYVYEQGWQDWAEAGAMTGTTGQGRQMQAIQIQLTDSAERIYDVYYRTHVENIGWMGWAKNGENAGTTGSKNRIEAIEIKLVPKFGEAPGSTEDAYREIHDINYIERIVNCANSQVGYIEVFDWTKYGQWYQDLFNAPGFSTTEWCAMFVSWCASESGVPQHIFPYHAYCPTGRQWFINRGLYQRNGYVPKAGDVVYFDWDYDDEVDHVGLVVGYDPSTGHVTTVEGNTGNGPGVERHAYPYNWGYINGFGIPQYNEIR